MPPFTQADTTAIQVLMSATQDTRSDHTHKLAPLLHLLYTRFVQCNHMNPMWINGDKILFSCGDMTTIQSHVLRYSGYNVDDRELELSKYGAEAFFNQFQESGNGYKPKVVVGDTGSGFVEAVGVALDTQELAENFNKANFPLITAKTWVVFDEEAALSSDATKAAEAAVEAELNNLIGILVAASPQTVRFYHMMGWRLLEVVDLSDLAQLEAVIVEALQEPHMPVVVHIRSIERSLESDVSDNTLVDEYHRWGDMPVESDQSVTTSLYTRFAIINASRELAWNHLREGYKAFYPADSAALEEVKRELEECYYDEREQEGGVKEGLVVPLERSSRSTPSRTPRLCAGL